MRQRLWVAAVLVAAVAASAFGGEPLVQWSFDRGLSGKTSAGEVTPLSGTGTLTKGRGGQGVQPGPQGLTYQLPEALEKAGTLSFWYRAPQLDKTKDLDILRLGKATLIRTMAGNRLYWKHPGDTAKEYSARAAILHYYFPGLREWELVEVEWGRTAAAKKDDPSKPADRIFVSGMQLCVSEKAALAPVEKRELQLLSGVFDEMRAWPGTDETGLRYTGVIYVEKFDAPTLPENWWAWRPEGQAKERTAGAMGSSGAITCKIPFPQVGNISGATPYILLTDDTYVCALLRADRDADWVVNLITPYNNWLPSVKLRKDRWTPVRALRGQYRYIQDLPLNATLVQACYVNPSNSTAKLSLDNFAVIRGKKDSRPTAPGDLKAEFGKEGVRLTWGPADDEAGVAGFRIFRSNMKEFPLGVGNEIGTVTEMTFVDTQIMMSGTWWYKVAAEDYMGNLGPAAGPVSVLVEE